MARTKTSSVKGDGSPAAEFKVRTLKAQFTKIAENERTECTCRGGSGFISMDLDGGDGFCLRLSE